MFIECIKFYAEKKTNLECFGVDNIKKIYSIKLFQNKMPNNRFSKLHN